MKVLSFSEITQAPPDVEYANIEVLEWGGTIRLSSVTASDMLEYVDGREPTEAMPESERKASRGARMIAAAVVNEDNTHATEAERVLLVARLMKAKRQRLKAGVNLRA